MVRLRHRKPRTLKKPMHPYEELLAWFNESPDTRSFNISLGKALGVQTSVTLRRRTISVTEEGEGSSVEPLVQALQKMREISFKKLRIKGSEEFLSVADFENPEKQVAYFNVEFGEAQLKNIAAHHGVSIQDIEVVSVAGDLP
jgi:hypothetical protein